VPPYTVESVRILAPGVTRETVAHVLARLTEARKNKPATSTTPRNK
jgi:hypothetical protein